MTFVAVILCTVVAAAGTGAHAAEAEASGLLNQNERRFLDAHGPIKWAVGIEIPPAIFTDDQNRSVGYVDDLMKLMSLRLGFDYEVVRADNLTAAIRMVSAGEADVLGPLTPSAAREGDLDFTPPFVKGELVFWTAIPEDELDDTERLDQYRVGALSQGQSHRWLAENHPEVDPVPMDETLEALHALAAGEIDIFVGGLGLVGWYIENEEGLGSLRILGAPVQLASGAWAVRDGDHFMLSILNKGMDAVSREEQATIFTKWTGYDLGVPEEQESVLTAAHKVLLGVTLGLIVVLGAGAFVLKQQVEARTRDLRFSEAQLRRRATALERSNEDLAQFAHVASHDLKEPLRMVKGFAELLDRRYGDALGDDGKEYLAHIEDGTAHMVRLVDDLLLYSRLDTEGRPMEPVDAERAFQAATDHLHTLIQERDADVQCGPLPHVLADDIQLVQLFQNLVGNAVKFSDGAQPVVEIGARHIDDEVRFHVKDHGIGIPSRHRDKVFQIFQRLHRDGAYPGTGIGLAICKRIVDRHGGRIWFESEEGTGTTFYFTLPSA